MRRSRLTKKGQTTIPVDIRSFLDLDSGDMVSFIIEGDKVVVRKSSSQDDEYMRSVEGTLATEWLSEADSQAYSDL